MQKPKISMDGARKNLNDYFSLLNLFYLIACAEIHLGPRSSLYKLPTHNLIGVKTGRGGRAV